jgi:glycerophosphoryl diester phosphodiesterase
MNPSKASRSGDELRTRPLAVAHRGFSWIAPENTLAAFQKAIDLGVEMAECDVHLSADRVPVVIHDESLRRTAGVDMMVKDLAAADLAKLDAGRWKDPKFAGERIPTLRQALELVRGRLRFVIEIKAAGMEQAVIDDLRAARVDPIDVVIFAFDRDVVAAIARIEPQLPTVWLIDDPPGGAAGRRTLAREALRARVSAVGLHKDDVDAPFLRSAHECGLGVFTWTVNEPDEMSRLAALGADGIISDRPDELLKVLEA